MSSEDNSDPMDSGNAFDGDSSGPLSPVGEQSLVFSWMESSGNNPASQGPVDAMRRQKDNEEVSSSGRERWSCVDLVSTISLCEVDKISRKYDVEVAFPQETGKPHNPPASHVIVSETFLKFGV